MIWLGQEIINLVLMDNKEEAISIRHIKIWAKNINIKKLENMVQDLDHSRIFINNKINIINISITNIKIRIFIMNLKKICIQILIKLVLIVNNLKGIIMYL